MVKIENAPIGKVGLIQETEDGRIIQLGLTQTQSECLQLFLASLSKESPLVNLGRDYELILKNT